VNFSKGTNISQEFYEEVHLERTTKKLKDRLKHYKLSDLEDDSQANSLAYEVVNVSPNNFASRRRPEYFSVKDNKSSKVLAGASLTHFLPKSLSMLYDSVDARATEIAEAITCVDPDRFHMMTRYRGSSFFSNVDAEELENNEKCKNIYIKIGCELLEEVTTGSKSVPKIKKALEDLNKKFGFENIRKFLNALTVPQRKSLMPKINDKYEDFIVAIKGEEKPVNKLAEVPLPDSIDFAVSYIQTFFSQYVKYLGPLRDEPKPVYPLAGGTDSKDIGFSGEHTAAVLDVHSKTQVNYLPSTFFKADITTLDTSSFVTTSLIDSVFDWLNYMGVASKVHTGDLGKLGHELKVSTIGSDRLHDLTHVGVGVSQVLPILVLALLAEANSVLIFEQPELHLHPKVQTRLADFFVSMTMLGKQCIVETHSEYMINRLRYRSAKAIDDSISKNAIIYFVEKIEEKSVYRSVRINKYGVIDKWPKGFFDESHDTASEILREGMKKKKLERN
jgi:predicted ATPase